MVFGLGELEVEEGLETGDEGKVADDCDAAGEVGGEGVEPAGEEPAPVVGRHGDGDVEVGGGAVGEGAFLVGDGEVPEAAVVAGEVELVDGGEVLGGMGAEALGELSEGVCGGCHANLQEEATIVCDL